MWWSFHYAQLGNILNIFFCFLVVLLHSQWTLSRRGLRPIISHQIGQSPIKAHVECGIFTCEQHSVIATIEGGILSSAQPACPSSFYRTMWTEQFSAGVNGTLLLPTLSSLVPSYYFLFRSFIRSLIVSSIEEFQYATIADMPSIRFCCHSSQSSLSGLRGEDKSQRRYI